MKKLLLALLLAFKTVPMEQPLIASDERKKDHDFDIKTFELHWGPFGFGESKLGWPHFYIDENNKKENLEAIVDHRIKKNLNLNFPIIARDQHGSPLYEACSSDDLLDITQKLIDHGADPNMPSYYDGQRPIHYAVSCFAIETIKTLIKAGAKVNAKMNNGSTPLHLISNNGYFNFRRDKQKHIIELLLANGARPNARNEVGQTPLFGLAYATTSKEDWPLMTTLLEHGARISIKDACGDSVKHRLEFFHRESAQFVKKKRKQVRLLRVLWNIGKKGNSPFKALPQEIMNMIIKYVYPEK